MTTLAQIASRLFNRPLYLHPASAEAILWALRDRMGDSVQIAPPSNAWDIDASRFVGTGKRADPERKALTRAHNGVAIVSTVGELVNRGAWVNANSGLISYEGLAAQFKDAATDPEVRQILWDMDSPGGEALGMSDLAAVVRQVNAVKPVTVVTNGIMGSAGYGIGSGASQIIASPMSLIGSIGTLLLHLDYSGRYAQAGVKPTLIYAGAHKVDGHPFGPLSDQVKEDLQNEVLAFYNDFVKTVAAGRGARLDEKAARATEARVFSGEEAVKLGLADRIGTFDQVLQELSSPAKRPGSTKPNGGKTMYSQEQYDAGVSAARAEGKTLGEAGKADAVNAAKAEGVTAGKAEGAKAERERVTGILALDETKGREKQAMALLTTDVSPETAKAVLAAAPKTGTIADRARGETEVGADLNNPKPEAAKSAWDKAVAKQNARHKAA